VADAPTGAVTFLFTDLEGSTRLWQEHPEAMKGALARHDELLRSAVAAHDGYVVKTTGDGVHAAFGEPHEAVLAAVDAQRALDAEAWPETGPLRIRMGVHTGPAEVRDGDYYGTAVNRAARLMSVAHGGQIVVSLTTEALVRDTSADIAFVDLGEHRLRDLSQAEHVFQVAADGITREFPPLRSVDAFRGNLPSQATSFIGRDSELAELSGVLRAARLVTITGVGGVGKTRLATQLAAEVLPSFADGARLCELAGATDGDSMHQIVAAELGVVQRDGVELVDAIANFLRAKNVLVVLDNCEHLLDPVALLARTIVHRCPDVRLLATSREGLGVAGEQVWPLRSLRVGATDDTDSEAVRLFVERAHAVRPTFVLDDTNRVHVTEVCRRLDGMPLSIELAAARVVSMTPREIAARLDERFRLLTGGRRAAVERHQTLRATVDWSYSLLDERDRVVLDRLGVFVGGFDADTATAVVVGDGIEEWDVVDALADLVAKSLIVSDDTAGGTTRFDMLETLRAYARERLDERGDADEWRRRHAASFAEFAEEAGNQVLGPDELLWRARIRSELDNLRAALTWSLDAPDSADAELGLRIVAGLAVQQGYDPALGIGDWAVRAMERDEVTTRARRQIVRAAAAYRLALAGDFDRAGELATEAAHGRVPDDSPWPSYPAYVHAYLSTTTGVDADALEICETALEEVGDRTGPMGLVTLHAVATNAARFVGQHDRARSHAEKALEYGRIAGCPSGLSSSLFAYGTSIRDVDPVAARVALEESIEWVARGGSPVVYGYALAALAPLRAAAGERLQALLVLRDALRYAADTANAALAGMIFFQTLGVSMEVGAPEVGVTLIPKAWLPWLSMPEHREMLESAEAALGEERFARARARGDAMSHDEAVMYATAELDRLIAEFGVA
jgi:predicted ATPase/class 3 adenylate cyclase